MTSQIENITQHEVNRDTGLIRAVGLWGLSFSIVNGVIGAGIFSLPASMAEYSGSYAPYAFIICAFAMCAVVICFAEAASRVPTSGGSYGYVDAAFGPLTGLVAGVLLWVSAVLACGGIVAALGEGVAKFFPQFDAGFVRAFVIIGSVILLAFINIIGVEKAARFIGFATLIKLVPLLIFIVFGGFYLLSNPQTQVTIGGGSDFGRAVILAIFAFSGMETILGASGEVAKPQKTIPRALFIAMGFILIVYIAIQLVAQGLLGSELAKSQTPLADGMARVFAPLGILLLIGASLSRFIWLASDLLGAPRILFAFARDGALPQAFAKIHKKYSTPYFAIIFHASLAIILALTGSFEQLAVLSSLATSALYFLSCAAAWRLSQQKIAIFGAPLNFRFIPLIAIIGMISMVITIFLAQMNEIIGLVSVILATIIFYFSLRFFKKAN